MARTYKRLDFKSWDERDGSVWNPDTREYEAKAKRAVALCDGTWFGLAINALRDGDMGAEGPDGVYERIWAADDIFNAEVADVRKANPSEVDLLLNHVTICDSIAAISGTEEQADNYILIRGDESYVLIPEE